VRKALLLSVVAGSAAAPAVAQAMELDYYTYNAFDETVGAFTRLALLFSDASFLGLIIVFAAIGIVIGALMTATKGVSGGQANPTAWIFPILFGVVLFKGLVLPTGRIDVYDPVRNAFQRVDGVPDFVVLIAGLLNKVERAVVEMVDTAGGTPYADDAGSIDFSLVNSAMSVPITDVNLDRSLSQYYTDCGTLALATNANGVTKQEFLRGSDDLLTTFAKFTNPAVFTVFYADGNDAGASMSCTDAWSAIAPQLENPATFNDMRNALCKVAGFDPGQAAQMARCEGELTNASTLYGVAAGSSLPFLRSVALAKSVSSAMNSADYSLQQRMLIDRQIMAEGFGVSQAANQWIPKLRGFIAACVLGLVPLTLLFVATPLVFRAIGLVCGLFVWLTLWGITDATAVVMVRDAAVSAFNDISNWHLGYDAILNSPDAAMQALGVFGKARTVAMGLATVISGALFHFASYELAMMSNAMQGQVDATGAHAGAQTLLPEQRAALIESLLHSPAPQAELATAGFSTAAAGAAMAAIRRDAATEGYVNRSLSQGIRPAVGNIAEGEGEGGGRVGALQASADVGAARGTPSVSEITRRQQLARSERELGQTFGELDQAGSGAGLYGVGHTQGSTHVAETQVAREVYRNINHTEQETPQGWRNVQQQLQGTALAISQIGDTEAYINAQKQLQLAANAAGAVAEARPGSSEMVGAMRQLQDTLHAQAFRDALRVVGEAGTRESMEFPLLQSAGTARAAQSAGGLAPVASKLARVQVAEQLGHADIVEALARGFGSDAASMSGLVAFTEDREGAQVTLPVTPENRERLIAKLKSAGLMSDFAEEQLRRARGGQVSFAFDRSRNAPVSLTLRAGSDTVFATTDRIEDGRALHAFWTDSVDLGSSVSGGASLLEVPNLEKGFLATYSSLATGSHPGELDGKWANWIAGLGEGLQLRGFRGEAMAAIQKSWRVNAGGSVGGGADIGIVGGKVSGGGGWSRDSSDQTVTTQNLNTTVSQQIIETSLHRAVEEYEKRHGAGSASEASQGELAHRAAEVAHRQFESVLGAERNATETGRETNSALVEAGQVSGSGGVGGMRQSMEDAIEESRKKLGPGFVR
jgi:hypothetical protein